MAGFFDGTVITHGTSIAVPHVVGIASLLWEKDLSNSNEFIRQLIDATSRKIAGTDDFGLADAEYAMDMYDDFETGTPTQWNIPSNEEPTQSFKDIEESEAYVEGRWSGEDHMSIIDGYVINNQNQINLLKAGMVYPDQDPILQGSISPEWHGGWTDSGTKINYIACYELITRAALKGGNISGVNYREVYGMSGIVYDWFEGVVSTTELGNRKWSSILSSYSGGNTATNRKYFLWGCAMHILTDTFAHSTVVKATGQDIGHSSGADQTNVYPGRYNVAKASVGYSLSCLFSNIYGDYYELYNGLKDEYKSPYNNWQKKRLLTYAQENSTGLTNAEYSLFNAAAASNNK